MGTPVCKFYDFEIEPIIDQFLQTRDITSKAPSDVAREIVMLARFAVPIVRKENAYYRSICIEDESMIRSAIEKVSRNEACRRPSRWYKKHRTAFDQFAEKNGRLDQAHSMCFIHKMYEADRVITEFLIEKGLPEMDDWDEAYKLALLIQDRCGQITDVPASSCRDCCREVRIRGTKQKCDT